MKIILVNKQASQGAPQGCYLATDSSMISTGKPFFVPDFAKKFEVRPSLVLRIGRLGKNIARRFAYRYYDAATVGFSTIASQFAHDPQGECEHSALATTFDGAIMVGDFVPVEQGADILHMPWSAACDDHELCALTLEQQGIDPDAIVEHVSRFYTLKMGDLIFTTTATEPQQIEIGNVLTAKLADKEILKIKIK